MKPFSGVYQLGTKIFLKEILDKLYEKAKISMTDKRYYYTDPLAAAWMAKHFGMRFKLQELNTIQDADFGECLDYSDFFFVEMGSYSPIEAGNEIFNIHPDSLRLLEPMKDDLVHIVRGFCSYYKKVASVATGGGKTVTGIWSDGEHWDITTREPMHDWEIIQRNGIPFMWPESE